MTDGLDIGVWNPRVGHATVGGTETFLRETIRRLADTHDITVYTHVTDSPPAALADADVVDVPALRKESPGVGTLCRYTPLLPAELESATMYASARAADRIRDMAHDVLTTHYYLDNLLVSRVAPCPTVYRFAGIKQRSPRWRAMLAAARPDRVLANSRATATRLREWYDYAVDGIVYAGVDASAFTPAQRRTDGGDRTILYAGRLDHGKGLEDLLHAVAELNDAHLRLVGDGVLRDTLDATARDLGISDRVTFAGRVAHDAMPGEYASATVCCLPSYHEGFPVVVIEALAAGCPVVASSIDAIRETISDGRTGWLVEPGNVAQLAGVLEGVLEDPAARQRVRSAGRDVARSFDWDVQARQFARELQEAAT